MTGAEKPAQILLPTTEIGGSVNIANLLVSETVNNMDPNIQPTVVQLKKETVPVHSDLNHFPIRSFNSGIDVTRSGRNIDNRNGMNS